MRDKHTIERIKNLHPKIREEVGKLIDQVEAGFPEWMAVRVVEHFRSIEYQDQLYSQGRTKPGKIVTNAKGGSSFHNYGLAIDFAILYDKDKNGSYESLSWDLLADFDKDGEKDWMEVVKVFEAAGYEWGGRWKSIKDNPHLQKTFGFKWQQLLAKYKAGETFIDNGNKYVKI